MNVEPMPCFIDFEASSLSVKSYPIEVAFSSEDGTIKSYLIDPSSVSYWNDWDSFAESLHQITLAQLQHTGLSPSSVAERLNDVLGGKVLFSDAQDYDWNWCQKLYDAAGFKPTFKISDASLLFKQQLTLTQQPALMDVMMQAPPSNERVTSTLNELTALAWSRLDCRRHRAACDVEHLIQVWKFIKGTTSTYHLHSFQYD